MSKRPDGRNLSGTVELGRAMHAAEHHDAQLVGDSLRYIEPVQLLLLLLLLLLLPVFQQVYFASPGYCP